MATTTNYGWETPDDTDLVKDGALAMRDLGQDVDTSLFSITGGKNVGLRLEQTYALSASSGISFTGMVVGARYRVTGCLSASVNNFAVLRYRENSTDKATNYFWAITNTNLAGAVAGASGNPDTQFYLGNIFAGSFSLFSADLAIPSASTGQMIGQYWDSNNGRNTTIAGSNSNMTNCNGISIFPSGGTLTGNVSIYRYA
jgi:hypothetical protein